MVLCIFISRVGSRLMMPPVGFDDFAIHMMGQSKLYSCCTRFGWVRVMTNPRLPSETSFLNTSNARGTPLSVKRYELPLLRAWSSSPFMQFSYLRPAWTARPSSVMSISCLPVVCFVPLILRTSRNFRLTFSSSGYDSITTPSTMYDSWLCEMSS